MSKLHEPIAGFKPYKYPQGDVTQFFGENYKLYHDNFGYNGHNGWDIVRAHGTPIYSVSSGRVVEAQPSDSIGEHVRIVDENGEWVYGHLSRIDVKANDLVVAGQQIGLMGNTGFVVSGATPYWEYNPYAGTHLHLTFYAGHLWKVGEPNWHHQYPTGDRLVLTYPNNGMNGAVDFKAEDFTLEMDTDLLLPSDRVALLAKNYQEQGNTKTAAMIYAIVQVLKAWGQ